MGPRRLGEILLEMGAIQDAALQAALDAQDLRRLGAVLVSSGACEAAPVRDALARQHGVPAVDLSTVELHPDVRDLLPVTLVQRCEVAALRAEGERLHVAAVDPQDELALDEVRRASGFTDLGISVTSQSDFAAFLTRVYGVGGALSGLADVRAVAEHVVAEVLRRDAAALHVEPGSRATRLRLRLDGALVPMMSVPRRHHPELAAALRSAAATARTRLRVAALDTEHGEAITLLREGGKMRALGALGLAPRTLEKLQQALDRPFGLVVVTGPRDSGCTTTAGAIAQHLTRSSRQVVVVGRAFGAAVPGTLAVAAGASYADAVERALALDPDVLVADGVDDAASAQAVVRAAAAGWRVVVTLSAGRAIDAVVRLRSEGVSNYLLGVATVAVLGQRLCRRVCAECSDRVDPEPAVLAEFRVPEDVAEKAQLRQGRGCARCGGTGYLGRVLVHEALFPGERMQIALRDGATPEALLVIARDDGFHGLWEDAIVQVLRGNTTFEEVRGTLTLP